MSNFKELLTFFRKKFFFSYPKIRKRFEIPKPGGFVNLLKIFLKFRKTEKMNKIS